MPKFSSITYQEVKILLEINDTSVFYPFTPNYRQLGQLPPYCKGIIELGNQVCLAIDLAEFLGVHEIDNDAEKLFVVVTGETGNIALIIPSTEVIEKDIEPISKDEKIQNNTDIPASKYVMVDGQIDLVVFSRKLLEFIHDEISVHLTKGWRKVDPRWHYFPSQHIKPETKDTLKISQKGTDIARGKTRNNYLILTIGDFKFGINEENVMEIQTDNHNPSEVPGSPPWIEGIIDFRSNDIPLININQWLDIDNNRVVDERLLLIIRNQNDFVYAVSCDSLTTVPQPQTKTQQHFQSRLFKDIPFTNIFKEQGDYVYVLNLEELGKSARKDKIEINHEAWRNYLENDKEKILRNIEDEASTQVRGVGNTDFEYLTITYSDIRVLFKFSGDHSFFPYQEVKTYMDYLPDYCVGLHEFENTTFIVVDLAEFLKLKDDTFSYDKDDLVFIKSKSDKGNILYLTPLPKVTNYLVPEEGVTITSDNYLSEDLPSTDYLILSSDEVYLKIDGIKTTEFLQKELGEKLSLKWAVDEPYWGIKLRKDFVDIKETYAVTSTSQQFKPVSGRNVDNLLVFEIGDFFFGINDYNVKEIIIASDIDYTDLPLSPYWVKGMIMFQNESIPVIDTAKWLDIEDHEELVNIVIMSYEGNEYGITIGSAYNIPKSDWKEIGNAAKTESLPYSSIAYTDELGWVYILNRKILYHSLESLPDFSGWDQWRIFFGGDREFKLSKYTSDLMDRESLLIQVEEVTLLIPVEQVIRIRAVVENEYHNLNGMTVVNFGNNWIPSINLIDKLDKEKSEGIISLVLRIGAKIFEIIGGAFLLTQAEDTQISKEELIHLISDQHELGITNLVNTPQGMAFVIDGERLYEKEFSFVDGNIKEYIDSFNLEKPEKTRTKRTGSIVDLWSTEVESYLICGYTDQEGEHEVAIPASSISKFDLYHPEEDTLQTWQIAQKGVESRMRVVIDQNGHQENYLVPENSYLINVAKHKVKSDETNTRFIDLQDDKKVPILTLQKEENK